MRPRWPVLTLSLRLGGGTVAPVGGRAATDPVSGPQDYDGRFVCARIRYPFGYAGGGFAYRQDLPAWSRVWVVPGSSLSSGSVTCRLEADPGRLHAFGRGGWQERPKTS